MNRRKIKGLKFNFVIIILTIGNVRRKIRKFCYLLASKLQTIYFWYSGSDPQTWNPSADLHFYSFVLHVYISFARFNVDAPRPNCCGVTRRSRNMFKVEVKRKTNLLCVRVFSFRGFQSPTTNTCAYTGRSEVTVGNINLQEQPEAA